MPRFGGSCAPVAAVLAALFVNTSWAWAVSLRTCPACPCDAGITFLSLRFIGPDGSQVRIEEDYDTATIFKATLNRGDMIDLHGGRSDGRFLTNALHIYVDDVKNAKIYLSCFRPMGVGFVFGPVEVVAFASYYGGLVTEPCRGECPCSGGVTFLSVRYSGPDGSQITVEDGALLIFDAVLNDGDTFDLNGTGAEDRFLTNDLRLLVNNVEDTEIHVSCSQPVGVGLIFESFTIEAFSSRDEGLFEEPCPRECFCHGGVTLLQMRYNGASGVSIMVEDGGGVVFGPSVVDDAQVLELTGGEADGTFSANRLYFNVDDVFNAMAHVSCTEPIDVGFVFGSFTVELLASRKGEACFGGCCGDHFLDANEECDGTADSACPGACQFDCTCLPDLCAGVVCATPIPPCEEGEVCNPATGQCDALLDAPPGTECEADGNTCTTDRCDGMGQCVFVSDSECSAVDPCHTAACDPGTGECVQTPISCDPMDACHTAACDPVSGACRQTEVSCHPVDNCHTASCNPATGVCVQSPIAGCCVEDGDCDDGNNCTRDTCVGNACTHDPSDGPGCRSGAIPTLTGWGTIILTLLLLAGGRVYFGRARKPLKS